MHVSLNNQSWDFQDSNSFVVPSNEVIEPKMSLFARNHFVRKIVIKCLLFHHPISELSLRWMVYWQKLLNHLAVLIMKEPFFSKNKVKSGFKYPVLVHNGESNFLYSWSHFHELPRFFWTIIRGSRRICHINKWTNTFEFFDYYCHTWSLINKIFTTNWMHFTNRGNQTIECSIGSWIPIRGLSTFRIIVIPKRNSQNCELSTT